jgi:hypothetical protein
VNLPAKDGFALLSLLLLVVFIYRLRTREPRLFGFAYLTDYYLFFSERGLFLRTNERLV